MISGAHTIIYSKKPEVDRSFFQNVLKLPCVDVGDGWLIFGLPPCEVAVHPSEKNNVHEFYLMCNNIRAFVSKMKNHGIRCSTVQNRGWGLLTNLRLPGGGTLGVYEPRHARPKPIQPSAAKK